MSTPHDGVISVNATFAKTASQAAEGLEAKIKAAMRAVLDNDFLAATDDQQIRAACGGVLLDVGEASAAGQRIIKSIDATRQACAFLSAATAGLNVQPPTPDPDAMPLVRWFMEIKNGPKG